MHLHTGLKGIFQMKTDGLILAGGKSSRMEGKHKGSLLYKSRTLTEHMALVLQSLADTVYISYGESIRQDTSVGIPVKDILPGCGPMSGLHAGLRAVQAAGGADFVLTAPCDMPLLESSFYRHLLAAAEKACTSAASEDEFPDAVVPFHASRIEPLAALYRPAAAGFFEEQLMTGQYALRLALDRMRVLYVDITGRSDLAGMLANINCPADYEALLLEQGKKQP